MAVTIARRDSKQRIELLEAKMRAAARAAEVREQAANAHNREHHMGDGKWLVLPETTWQDMPTEPTTQWTEIFKR